jgi:sigma-B regulation protein RsbU (phosphoserine phosphatase)
MAGAHEIRDDERFRRIATVTDAALATLDVPHMLDELLDRLRELLSVDTAVILLLEEHSDRLVVTAARGVEEEVRHAFRVPVGAGFAGRVAASRQPMRLTDVASADIVSPTLRDKGLRSLLGVPMLAAGRLVGVLHVGSYADRDFTDDDVDLLQVVADRAALASQTRAAHLDQVAAAALQRSLVPGQLPTIRGVDIAARYVPGHEFGVGGDWYDVFTLPGDRVGVVIGDVSGHGLRSAVVMGRIRSALRAYALICDDPAEAMTLLDRKIHHFEAGNLTTALYAVISPDRGTIQMSLAGHLPPILAVPGLSAAVVDVGVDPPLGIGRLHRSRRSTQMPFLPGAVLLCYTDGAVERRGHVIDVGIAQLVAAVTAGTAEQVCERAILGVDAEPLRDDIALLAVHRHAVS